MGTTAGTDFGLLVPIHAGGRSSGTSEPESSLFLWILSLSTLKMFRLMFLVSIFAASLMLEVICYLNRKLMSEMSCSAPTWR